jgi:hypothetical protein
MVLETSKRQIGASLLSAGNGVITIPRMRYITLLCFLFLASLCANATTLLGAVEDSQGAAISKAYVLVRWDSVGLDSVKNNAGDKNNHVTATDDMGHFSFDLPPGVYDIFVSAPGFFPHCKKITVGAKYPTHYKARLRASRTLSVTVD